MLEVLDPTHGEQPGDFRLAQRLPSLEGMTIGLISNGKQGTAPFFAALSETFLDFGAATVDLVVKGNYSAPAEAAVMDRAKRWNAMVAGVGD